VVRGGVGAPLVWGCPVLLRSAQGPHPSRRARTKDARQAQHIPAARVKSLLLYTAAYNALYLAPL
jgi:hypothetical protein